MISFNSLSRPARLASGLLVVAAMAAATCLHGQVLAEQLQPFVVLADRIPESPATVGTDLMIETGADLQRQQLQTIADALAGFPSAPVFATGQSGAATSLFLRGANSNQTLFLVDGIRLNDGNVDYGPFISGTRMFSGDRMEVALGPQSTLYGGGAAGGVVSLSTPRGSGSPTGDLAAEAGSFSTVDGMVTAGGASGGWGYNLAASASHTDNDRINNVYNSENARLRLDWDASPTVSFGATARDLVARYGDPGDKYTNDPYAHETEDSWLGTLFADVHPSANFSSHLIVGGQYRDYDSFDSSPANPQAPTLERDRRRVVDWQNIVEWPGHNRLVAGLTAEDDSTVNNGFGDVDHRQSSLAFFAEDAWTVVDELTLTGGVRTDDYDTFGRAGTGRLTAAWLVADRTIKLRSSYGTAFDAPTFLDLYSVNPYFVGNTNLMPERTRGWDAGADAYLPAKAGTISATWFQDDFENLIVDNFNIFPAMAENVGRARTRGLELSWHAAVAGFLQTRIAYTRLEAEDLTDQTPLLRRPHYTASVDLSAPDGRNVTLGGGASWVGVRADVDAQTFATVDDPAYSVARFYASWQATDHLALKARVENAFDRRYEPVNGYPALPRGIYGSAEWKF